jgi:Ni/Fe-hydrogenase subunit HybB-like protein
MGYSVVMLEATLVSDRFARISEAHILGLLSRYLIAVVTAFLTIRWSALLYQGKLHFLFTSGGLSFAFLAENALYLIPVILLWPEHRRMAPRYQFIAAMCILSGGILYRLDAYMIAYGRTGWHYFPSVPELLVTFGMIAVEVLGYVLIVKFFPVLPSVEHAQTAALATK